MKITEHIREFGKMKRYPESLYYKGLPSLLSRPKISMVGTRRPNAYTRSMTYELSKKLSVAGLVIVSGAAAGVDALAHEGAGTANTIAVLPCGIDHRYPASNGILIESIEKNGLIISPFEPDFLATPWSFVVRNEIVVALGEALIVTEADLSSGSMRSVEYAIAMEKPIYVLPHRLRESSATRQLVREGKASAIDDIDLFVARMSQKGKNSIEDTPFIAYCRTNPIYDEAVVKFPSEIFEAELSGTIEVRNGRVWVG
ncbi:SMF family protein [Sulfuricurvum kujiense DSM 16994]|uniref:SMF family protein n=1 Tax=Sulfuricurvum kujiense (strain ATCC BAA-921 / DSM 16994 / JCM 11577 / YK-1) TaxID=709032 RepID=E4U0G3_SULKY|nr:DNA-processing protein DprA [Sulfuricurvum kujiense]ADR33260.1 SMF family protein [Sulfuricurvum kujiense DSM 16994]